LFKNIGNNVSNANEFEKRMNTFLVSQPDAHFHRRLLADFFITNKRYQEAEAHYRILAAVDNLYDKATVLNNLAIITIPKDLEKALSFSEEALAESPNAPDLLDTHGWILSLQGKYEEALPSLRRAYSYNAVDPNIMYHLGVVLAKQGKTAQAKLELKNALASDMPFDDRAQAKALLQSLETP
jgi:tetratricopeptide (TPR) repeat protein